VAVAPAAGQQRDHRHGIADDDGTERDRGMQACVAGDARDQFAGAALLKNASANSWRCSKAVRRSAIERARPLQQIDVQIRDTRRKIITVGMQAMAMASVNVGRMRADLGSQLSIVGPRLEERARLQLLGQNLFLSGRTPGLRHLHHHIKTLADRRHIPRSTQDERVR